VCFCGKPSPVGGKRFEDIVQYGLWAPPGAAVVWKAFYPQLTAKFFEETIPAGSMVIDGLRKAGLPEE